MRIRVVLAVMLGVFFFGPSTPDAHTALIIFKDGFTISGKVKEQRKLEIENNVPIHIPTGFIYVDDGARRIIFSPSATQVIEVLKDDPAAKENIRLLRSGIFARGDKILPGWRVENVTPWNKRLERTIKVDTGRGKLDIDQRVVILSTDFIQVQSVKFEWNPIYKTRELGAETVRTLVDSFYRLQKDSKDPKKEMPEPQRRLEIFKFLYQAGWLEEAEKELDDLINEFPEDKSLAEPHKENLKKVRATVFAEDIERLHQAGQHREAEKRLGYFFKNDGPKFVSEKTMLQVQALKSKHEGSHEKLRQAAQFLKELPGRIATDEGQPGAAQVEGLKNRILFGRAAKEIGDALHFDTLARLETFLVYAQQHDREVKDKRKPSQPPEDVLALALTGWTRGDAAAETDVKLAGALWELRRLLLQKNADVQTILSHCKAHSLGTDVVAQVIALLPPPDPPADMKNKPALMEIIAPDARAGEYWIQLPPEYHAGRYYPVLIVLHGAGEKADVMLARWSALASQHGYILVAPVWGGPRTPYEYGEREHSLVLDTIRDLRRRFSVDSDRVFLYGREHGGLMAFDVGLSHPDQFAGVLPHNAAPRYAKGGGIDFPSRYWSNAQYLPFYVVDGDFNSSSPAHNRTLFKDWIRGQYPCIYVEYKGRGIEWFAEEPPIMFDWMRPKRRMHPTRELGRYSTTGSDGEEFKTMRETDNRFYWLSTDSIAPQCINSMAEWKHHKLPAKLQANIIIANQADIRPDPKDPKKGGGVVDKVRISNQINLRTSGVKQVTIWIGPNMIDFTKPVGIRHNSTQLSGQMKVQPSLQTLVEEFLYHWDRQRLFFAKIELKL